MGCAAVWASDASVRQRLHYRELRRRTKKLPSEIRERILWDSALECFVPGTVESRAPDLGYFVLPVRSPGTDDELETLLLPPGRDCPWLRQQFKHDSSEDGGSEGDMHSS